MSTPPRTPRPGESAWNPGLESTIPPHLHPLCTFLRPGNVLTGAAEAREIHGLTGLPEPDFVVFRATRLALHEVLVRMTAEISVPDSDRIEQLGINFREMTSRVMARLAPRRADWDSIQVRCRAEALAAIGPRLERLGAEAAAVEAARWLEWNAGSPAERRALRALGRVVSSILVRHGRLWGPREVIAQVAAGMAANECASQGFGEALD